ncbi:hypothetical protein RND81_09G189700 [Saponaria officinalis]|uniref:Protein IQ-DOMAIN 1 n=1 Tax=Saponaria officinalis TaxID=3572 RepID=A0AAW1IMS9_SAPOF
MGISVELVRSVFSKSHSTTSPHYTPNVKKKKNMVEKKRWKRSVRSYLCGDELLFNSVLAEEDTASVKSSEATVSQAMPRESVSTDKAEDFSSHSHSVNSKLLDENAAAFVIQAAFRGFLMRRLWRESTGLNEDVLKGFESPSRESLATSIEAQTGNSIGVVSTQEEFPSVCTKLQHHKPKLSLFRQKEDWDDSTVDSSVSKMRTQNRLEAMTRRERALAYAFSQQLRICSKNKRPTISGSTEPNTSWSWLERWMATRQHEGLSVEDQISKQLSELSTTLKTKPIIQKKFLDLSFEEKESCGSNEVPVQVGVSTLNPTTDGYKLSKNRLKSPRNISRRKTVPTGQYHKEHTKVNKREVDDDDKRSNTKLLGSVGACVSEDEVSQLSADHSVAFQNSKSDP